jgi:hypothetical protein
MRILTSREASTMRAALSLWQRTENPSPAFVHMATDGNIFPPCDPEEVEELIVALARIRVCVSDVQSDMMSFIRKVAGMSTLDADFADTLDLLDEAKELCERMGKE